jgi:hypothetical protein
MCSNQQIQNTAFEYSQIPTSSFDGFAFHPLFSLHERKTVSLHLDRDLEQIIKTLCPDVRLHSSASLVNHMILTSVCVFAFSQSFPYRNGRSESAPTVTCGDK